jgi:phosphodiesterase/alkaline phosphatase D-like protein
MNDDSQEPTVAGVGSVRYERVVPELLLGPLLRHVGRETATIWVETDESCRVKILDAEEVTFEVSGHHYALVCVDGLEVGSCTEYTVELNGEQVWPAPGSQAPPSRIRTLQPDRPQRITFGSCRVASQHSVSSWRRFGVDALGAYAVRTASHPDDGWPDLLLMLGDQVYADDTTQQTQDRIAARRDPKQPPGTEVANFEEYTWLYHESWSETEIRWLMSTVPVAMIFDDHDVHDDWNTSRAWRAEMQATDWWAERITGALVSYWVYQHIGNLSPEELAADTVYAKVRAAAEAGEDAAPILRAFAQAADREADGAKGYRWSFWRDLGSVRLVVIDSRCGRMLDGDQRSMLSDSEFDWIEERLEGDFDHLLIGTSLPWLMAPALHALETWNEEMSAAERRPATRNFAEKLRVGADLEHWPAFSASFDRLARMLADIGSGRHGAAPATICVLSGDVHHSYVCEADLSVLAAQSGDAPVTSQIYQVTCSPVHNWVPGVLKALLGGLWSAPVAGVITRVLGRRGRLARPMLTWRTIGGPFFGNAISTLVLEGRAARLVMESSRKATREHPLEAVVVRDLSS